MPHGGPDHHLNFSLFLFSTSVELVPRNVCPTETIMIFVSYVHFDGEFIYLKSFRLKNEHGQFLGSSMAELSVFEHFCDIVGTHSPVPGLFKIGSERFVGLKRNFPVFNFSEISV